MDHEQYHKTKQYSNIFVAFPTRHLFLVSNRKDAGLVERQTLGQGVLTSTTPRCDVNNRTLMGYKQQSVWAGQKYPNNMYTHIYSLSSIFMHVLNADLLPKNGHPLAIIG